MSTTKSETTSLAERFEAALDVFLTLPYDTRREVRADAFLYLSGYLGRAIRDDDVDAALVVRAFERAALEVTPLRDAGATP